MPPKRKVKIPEIEESNSGENLSSGVALKKTKFLRSDARAISMSDPNLPDHIFDWTIPNIDSLDDKGRESLPHKVKGLPWYIRVRTENSDRTKNMKHLSLYLYCGETNDSTVWYADATADFSVRNRNEALSVTEKFSYRFRAGFVNSGYAGIYPWNDLVDPRKGFVKDNVLTVQIRLKVLLVRGVRDPPTLRDFTQPLPNLSDCTLTIEGKKLYISKQFLALHSPVFEALFFHGFRESSQPNVDLEDVNYEDFLELLHVLYPPSAKTLNITTCPAVLKLADQFQFKSVLTHIERFIIDNKDIAKSTLLKWADQYNLFDAQNACMAQLKKAEDIKTLQIQRDYVYLSDSLKLMITEKLLKFVEKEAKNANNP